ncbi:hypothetical protein GCM10022226_47160 [Sphaerisporangium flaviroseum]|uniref:protein adenylyltransferase n=1 Tax=Sphaerisporangium flaviroseum TaxID=509199 RepID=A0ABP7ILU0_9ACTN
MARAEADVALLRYFEVAVGIVRIEGRYDLAHLQGFHRHLFGDVYPWAGQIRTVGIAKQDVFCLPQFIEGYAAAVFSNLAADNWLRGTDHRGFVSGLALYFSEINALHPFREGNGRTQRAFLSQLAADAGFHIAWSRLDPQDNLAISVAGFHGDVQTVAVVLGPLVAVNRGLEPWAHDLLVGSPDPSLIPPATAARARSVSAPVQQASATPPPKPPRRRTSGKPRRRCR